MLFAILGSLLIGGVVGLGVSWRFRSPEPSAPHRLLPPSDDHDLDVVLRAAADELGLSVVVADSSGSVVYRNRAAMAMRGTHVGVIVEASVERALGAARGGERVDDVVEFHGPPRVALQLVAEPMPQGYAVATVANVSERTQLDVMRTDFVANISHELKTPVGAIAVLGDALVGETNPEVIDSVTVRMVDEARRAVGTIDDLLELSRIESGPLLKEVVDLDDMVDTAIARGRAVGKSKGVTITSFNGHPAVRLQVDHRQLLAALGNLVENAVKYSNEDGVVEVKIQVDDRAVEVTVTDQGIGISERDLERIFERFYRVDRARSRTTGGSGLGLSIVRHVASNHGGEVLVSSQEGEGSAFVLRLPKALLVDMSCDECDPVEPLEAAVQSAEMLGSVLDD